MHIIFEDLWRIIIVLHALSAIVLSGSITHDIIIHIIFLKGDYSRKYQHKIFVKIAFISYLSTFTLGSIIYPTFRYYGRALYFDKEIPLATAFFEIKEHWESMGLALFLVYYPFTRIFDIEKDNDVKILYIALSFFLGIIILFSLIVGLVLTTLKAI